MTIRRAPAGPPGSVGDFQSVNVMVAVSFFARKTMRWMAFSGVPGAASPVPYHLIGKCRVDVTFGMMSASAISALNT